MKRLRQLAIEAVCLAVLGAAAIVGMRTAALIWPETPAPVRLIVHDNNRCAV